MANIKITDLTAYTDPESTDVLPIVDITNDETKQVSIADLMENAGSGTAALPGIAFDGDPNTGIYRPGADQIAISTAGTQRILIDDSGVVTIAGDLTVNGTTTTVNSTTVTVDDKNIELGSVDTPTDTTADGGGITLKGATDKTLNWVNSTDSWTSSENVDLASGKTYKINGTDVLSGSTLGSGVTDSSLTSVGNLTDLNVVSVNSSAETVASFGNSSISGGLQILTNGNLDWGLNARNSRNLTFSTDQLERARLDSLGRLLLGTNVNTTGGGGFYLQTAGTTQAEASILQIGYINAAGGPIHRFIHDKATTVGGTNTSVANNDKLGELQFLGADGAGYVQSAQISAEVDGTPGTDTMPGRLVFSTTTTNSPTARMTIDSSGNVGINETSPAERLHVSGAGETVLVTPVNYSTNVDSAYLIAGTPNYSGATTNWGTYGVQHRIKSDGSGVVRVTIDDLNGEIFTVQAGNQSRVGVNQSAPGADLDVLGDALINGLTIGMGAGSLAGNTAIGNSVLGNAASGSTNNTGVGHLALQDLTTGAENVAVGKNAGAGITEAVGNIFVGRNAGYLTTTANINVGIGYLAFDNNTTGQANVAVGQRALSENVAGNNSVAIGTNSQRYANSTATAYSNTNVSVGHQALMGSTTAANNTGANNVCMGYVSMQNNTTGYNNVAVGYSTLFDNTSGVSNIAIGMRVLENNTTGNNTVAIGYDALKNNVAGNSGVAIGYNSQVYVNNSATAWTNSNTSVGYQALRGSSTPADNTGAGNTAIGYLALLDVSTGSNNTAIGSGTGSDVTTGARNILVGNVAGRNITTADDNLAIGYLAFDNASVVSNCTAIGYEAQRYADSTTTAKDGNNTSVGWRALRGSTTAADNTGTNNTAVGYSTLLLNTSGTGNVSIGHQAIYHNTTGSSNTAVGANALFRNTTGANNSALGNGAGRYEQDGSDDANYTNCTYLGFDTRASGDNQVQLGNSSTTTYAYGSVQDRSDERDKTDIRDTVIGLDFINTLRPVDFRWDMRDDYFDTEVYEEEETETVEVPNPAYIEDGDEPQYIEETRTKMVTKDRLVPVTKDGSRKRNRFHHGLIAQEVKAAADAAGVDFAGYQDHSVGGGKDVLTLGYSELIAPLIKAVQELSAENAALKARLDALEGV